MPVNIGVEGGSTRQVAQRNISKLDSEQALESLQQIRSHLSKPGRDSGVLTLHNRTKTGSEMTLERKNSFQLLFQGEKRLDDTVKAMKSLLEKAGKYGALQELDHYLVFGKGDRNKIESSKMLEILNRHLPQVGPSKEDVYRFAGLDKEKTFLGNGATGSVYDVGGGRVLKEFSNHKVQPLNLDRSQTVQSGYLTPAQNEAIGSYLTPKNPNKHPNYLQTVNITQPTSYLVSVKKEGGEEFRLLNPHAMRTFVKEAVETGTEVMCHGLVMPKAKGVEVEELIEKGTLTETEKRQFVGSTLKSIRGLNERGFIHHDLKPGNTYFDRETGTTTLVDTGTLFKSSKNQDKFKDSKYITGPNSIGTSNYMHPRGRAPKEENQKHGTETDLWALGIMTLEVEHSVAIKHLQDNRIDPGSITKEELTKQIGEAPSPAKEALVRFQEEMNKENGLTGFAMKCFEMALLPHEEWGNRETSRKMYDGLMLHPALQVPKTDQR